MKLFGFFKKGRMLSQPDRKEQTPSAPSPRLIAKLNNERRMRKLVAITLASISSAFLLVFGIAALREFTGSFTINLNYNDSQGGFSLYDNLLFNDATTRLSAEPLKNHMTNITLTDLDLEAIDSLDGSNHGAANLSESAYFAYTFYIKNTSPEPGRYETRINLADAAKGADEAARIIIIEDTLTYGTPDNERVSTVYGKEKNGGGLDVFCDKSFLANRGCIIYFEKELLPGQSHKYTIIMYLEGEDPECTDDIKGGMLKLDMEFLVL